MFCQFRQISSAIGIHTTRVNIGDFGDFDKFGNFGDVLPISSNYFIHWYLYYAGEHWRFRQIRQLQLSFYGSVNYTFHECP